MASSISCNAELKKILLGAGKIFRGRSTAQKDMHVELLTYIT